MFKIPSCQRLKRPVLAVLASLALTGLVACSDQSNESGSGPSQNSQPPASAPPSSTSPSLASPTSTSPSPETSATPTSSASDSSAPAPGRSDDGAALLKAGAVAVDKVPDSTLTSIEREAGGWEAQVVTADGTEHQLDLSADGAKVLRGPTKERDDAEDKAKHKERVADAKVDYRTAVKTLLTTVPGGDITELNLDSERGSTVWEADVLDAKSSKHEVRIDAVSGKVLRNTIDD